MNKLINLKIAIIPSVKETYKNQFELSVDLRLIKFLKFCFKKTSIQILKDQNDKINDLNLLILSGGNDIYTYRKNKRNHIRKKIDAYFMKRAMKNNTPILGICYGAQFIADYFGNKLIKVKKHNNEYNRIKIKKNNFINKKSIIVKCYHNYSIKKKNKILDEIGLCDNNYVEFFKIKNKKIYGVMWHPERNLKIKKYDYQLLKKICS